MGESERNRKLTARDRWFAAAMTVALAALYFALRSRDIGYDAVAYCSVADTPSFGRLFHQNHPLLTPAFWCVMRVVRGLGYAGSSLTPPAALSALWAGAASGGFYLVLRRIGARPASAALAVAAASFSAAWWYFAGLAEPVACILFFIVGALFLVAPWPPSWRRALAVGCWLGIGTWFHVTVALFIPVAGVLVAGGRGGRWGRWAALFAAYAVTASAAYAVISQCVLRHEGLAAFWDWINSYRSHSDAYGSLTASRVPDGLLQILVASVAPRRELHLESIHMGFGTAAFKFAPAAALVGVALVTIGVAVRRLWREHRRWLVAAAVWFVSYQLFFTWWESGNNSWWAGVTLPVWLLFALAAPARRVFLIPFGAVVLVAAGVNFDRVILPSSRPGHNGAENAARVFIAASRPGDNLWVPHSAVELWIRHLTRDDRPLTKTGLGTIPGSYTGRAISLARRGPANAPAGADVYMTDYELDNPRLGKGRRARAAKKAFFKILRNAEPVTLTYFYGRPRVLYRYRGAAEFGSLRIYEAERGTRDNEFRVLDRPGCAERFKVKILEKGRYVISVQASGTPARGEWPAASVAVDGDVLSTFAVTSDYWWFYDTRTTLDPGKHEIKVILRNGLPDRATGETRVLYVNRLAIYRDPAEGRGANPAAPEKDERRPKER